MDLCLSVLFRDWPLPTFGLKMKWMAADALEKKEDKTKQDKQHILKKGNETMMWCFVLNSLSFRKPLPTPRLTYAGTPSHSSSFTPLRSLSRAAALSNPKNKGLGAVGRLLNSG